jgi:hypothetical protein
MKIWKMIVVHIWQKVANAALNGEYPFTDSGLPSLKSFLSVLVGPGHC